MKYICIITLLVLCLILLLLTGCITNTVTPEIDNGNLENQTVEELAIEESATAKLDTTKPVITGSRAPLPNALGWNNTDVTVSFSCEDAGLVQSGIETNTVAGKTVTTEGKDQSVTNTGTCIDAAGNVADPVTVSNINIDKTPPVVTITLPKNGKYKLNESVTGTWSAIDSLSGVKDSKAPKKFELDTKSKGWKNFTLPPGLVKDEAGNSSEEVTISYEVIADTEEPATEEPATEEPATEEPATEEPATEEPGTVYPQKWATGDGTVGDPWANDCIQEAYDAVPTGGTIYLRAGYYQLADKVTVAKSINIIGEGREKTFIITADAYGFSITADHVTIRGMTIDGAAQTEGGDENHLYNSPISISDCDYALLEDIEAKNAGYCGINLFKVNHASLQNIYAHDNYKSGVHARTNVSGRNKYNTYRDIYVWDNGVDGFACAGYEKSDPEELNNVYDNIQAWGNERIGIALLYMIGGSLTNSSAHGHKMHGIYLDEVHNFTVENCSAYSNDDSGSEAIRLYHCSNLNLTDVIVKNNYTGIVLYEGCSNIALTSCQSYDDRETPLQRFGLQLGETNTNISLLNCKLIPNKLGDIYNPAGVVVTVITEKMLAKF